MSKHPMRFLTEEERETVNEYRKVITNTLVKHYKDNKGKRKLTLRSLYETIPQCEAIDKVFENHYFEYQSLIDRRHYTQAYGLFMDIRDRIELGLESCAMRKAEEAITPWHHDSIIAYMIKHPYTQVRSEVANGLSGWECFDYGTFCYEWAKMIQSGELVFSDMVWVESLNGCYELNGYVLNDDIRNTKVELSAYKGNEWYDIKKFRGEVWEDYLSDFIVPKMYRGWRK